MHPRTAVGFSADGGVMYLLTVDGRMAASRGMTLQEVGEFLAEVGASDGINLDGGGSSTMVAREAGESDLDVENEPSDGHLRNVPDGIGLFAATGSGQLTGMRLVPATDEENDELWKIFPTLTRRVVALGSDETYAPVAATPRYQARGHVQVSIDDDHAVLRATRPGEAVITAKIKGLKQSHNLTVLGPLHTVRSTVDKVTILKPDDLGHFSIVGADANGFEAPIETADVTLDYDRSKLTITPTADGRFEVTAADGVTSAGEVVTVTVADVKTYVPVAVGAVTTVLSNFDDVQPAADWYFTNARAAGNLQAAPGRTGTALKMNFDFTLSTATRVGYARPAQPITITQGQPLALGVWIHGDNQGEWTSIGITDGTGKSASLYGPYINWTGWKYVEIGVPQTLQGPIRVNFLAAIETKASQSYRGSVIFDDLTVKTAPEVSVPASATTTNPTIVQHVAPRESGDRWTFAVMSDGQFTAANQSLVPAVRRTMQEIVAAKPDFVVITGDLVDTGYPADFALAKQVIDDELTAKGMKWYYVPGNHEIYGPGSVSNFEAVFGPAHRTFDHQGTRFVLLDSSTGTLSGGGFDQWQLLRGALDSAANDDAINGVAVAWHHPPRDPGPVKASQMTNRIEAQTVENWLSDFRVRTGKGAAFLGGHVGAFSATTVNGVPYIINGNSGKSPSTSPTEGGFSGWTRLVIDPHARALPGKKLYQSNPFDPKYQPWIVAEVRPHVDTLTLTAPKTLGLGEKAAVTATITQGTRSFPIGYPASAAWTGEGVHIGSASTAKGRKHVAAYDPATRTLTGLKAGRATLLVTVNGVTQTAAFNVG